MMKIYKKAGERIYLTRVMRGYTREDLAELAFISPKFLYEIETGRKGFSAVVLYNICQALKVDCDYIMFGESKSEYKDEKIITIIETMNTKQIAAAEKMFRLMADLCDVL